MSSVDGHDEGQQVNNNPTGYGATISLATEAVLIGLKAVNVLPGNDAQITALNLAIADVAR